MQSQGSMRLERDRELEVMRALVEIDNVLRTYSKTRNTWMSLVKMSQVARIPA